MTADSVDSWTLTPVCCLTRSLISLEILMLLIFFFTSSSIRSSFKFLYSKCSSTQRNPTLQTLTLALIPSTPPHPTNPNPNFSPHHWLSAIFHGSSLLLCQRGPPPPQNCSLNEWDHANAMEMWPTCRQSEHSCVICSHPARVPEGCFWFGIDMIHIQPPLLVLFCRLSPKTKDGVSVQHLVQQFVLWH